MFLGTVNGCAAYPREIAKAALRCNAAAVIVAHNHPAGDPEPSIGDEWLTDRLAGALALIDVRLLNHIVVAGSGCTSIMGERTRRQEATKRKKLRKRAKA